jgi:hypothetical protein
MVGEIVGLINYGFRLWIILMHSDLSILPTLFVPSIQFLGSCLDNNIGMALGSQGVPVIQTTGEYILQIGESQQHVLHIAIFDVRFSALLTETW